MKQTQEKAEVERAAEEAKEPHPLNLTPDPQFTQLKPRKNLSKSLHKINNMQSRNKHRSRRRRRGQQIRRRKRRKISLPHPKTPASKLETPNQTSNVPTIKQPHQEEAEEERVAEEEAKARERERDSCQTS